MNPGQSSTYSTQRLFVILCPCISGELKNPGRSIPRGTLFALLFTFLVYLGLFLITALTTTHEALVNNYVFMAYISVWQPLVYAGTSSRRTSSGNSYSGRDAVKLSEDTFVNYILKY